MPILARRSVGRGAWQREAVPGNAPTSQWPQPQLPPQQPPPPPTIAPSGRDVAKEDSRRVTLDSPQLGQRTEDSSFTETSSSNVSEHPAQRYS